MARECGGFASRPDPLTKKGDKDRIFLVCQMQDFAEIEFLQIAKNRPC